LLTAYFDALILLAFTFPSGEGRLVLKSGDGDAARLNRPRMTTSVKLTIMTNFLSRFMEDESGATAIEYGLTAVLIGIALIVAAGSVGTKLSATFNYVPTQLNT
jgi:pilus assembly protein Flp/PilA